MKMKNLKDLLNEYENAINESEREELYNKIKRYYTKDYETIEQVFRKENNIDQLDRFIGKGKMIVIGGVALAVIAIVAIIVMGYLNPNVKMTNGGFSTLEYFAGFGCLVLGTLIATVQRIIKI